MSAELWEALSTADAEGEDPIVAAITAVSSPQVIHAAWVLSVVLAIDEPTLAEVLKELWSDDAEHEAAVETLLGWPFVELTTDGYRISEAAADGIRAAFFDQDPARFRRAHELLARSEEQQEGDADADETWFVRGRVAYYLAGFDEGAAVDAFGANFASPPSLERTDARMWLSWLAVRQEPLLTSRTREVSFFRGFRCYVYGQRDQARRDFDAVIGRGDTDRYEALATHFAGVLRRRTSPDEGIELLRSSIGLSHELGLHENEIMARQSLVTALIVRATHEDLEESSALADLNLEQARVANDPHLLLWCRASAAKARWLCLTNMAAAVTHSARQAAPRILEELRVVAYEALIDDPENALVAVNDLAGILRDLGEWEEAVREIDTWMAAAADVRVPAPAFGRLAKTVGSLCRFAEGSGEQAIEALLAAVEQRMPESGRRRR